MSAFEQVLYYYSLGLFVIANCCFWGLLGSVAFLRLRNFFKRKMSNMKCNCTVCNCGQSCDCMCCDCNKK